MNSMSLLKIILVMIFCGGIGVAFHVCSDVPIPLNDTPVLITLDCSTLQCEDILFEINFLNNLRCNTWTMNGKSHNSPMLVENSKTQYSVTVNMTAVCLDQQTPAHLQCHSYSPFYSIRIQIYNSMCLLSILYYRFETFALLSMCDKVQPVKLPLYIMT